MFRFASFGLVLFGVSTLAFALAALAPGDPAELFLERALGRPPTESQIAEQRQVMGLDRTLPRRYAAWLSGLLHGDLGQSWGAGRSVASVLADNAPQTAVLAVTSLLLSLGVSLPLGVASAARPHATVDRASRAAAVVGASIPTFFLGYLMMWIFGVKLGLLPIFGSGSPIYVVLPALTLSFATTGVFTRVIRAGTLAALQEDYVRGALARGVSARAALIRHALRNALIPLITVAGLAFGQLLGGAVIVEWIFSWPGLGKLGVDAIHNRDYPLIVGWMLCMGLMAMLTNLAADLACAWADPRVRLRPRDA